MTLVTFPRVSRIMQMACIVALIEICGDLRDFINSKSFLLIHFRASSAYCNAGIASAKSSSHSFFITLASSTAYCTTASSFLIYSAN